MPRRRVIVKRPIPEDPRYKSALVTMLVNAIMRQGKKQLAFKIVYRAFDQIAEKLKPYFEKEYLEQNQVETSETKNSEQSVPREVLSENQISLMVFTKGIENMMPEVEVQSRRVGGSTLQVPKPITPRRRKMLALNFLKRAILARKKNTTFYAGDKAASKLLALEIIDAYEGKGGAIKMRSDMHRMARANQAYVHFQPAVSKPSP